MPGRNDHGSRMAIEDSSYSIDFDSTEKSRRANDENHNTRILKYNYTKTKRMAKKNN